MLVLAVFIFFGYPALTRADSTAYSPQCYNQKITPAQEQSIINGTADTSTSTAVQGALDSTSYSNFSTTSVDGFVQQNNAVAGTCRLIKSIYNTISIDPALQDSYWLATHFGIGVTVQSATKDVCAQYTCTGIESSGAIGPPVVYTKHSEYITNISTSTTVTVADSPDDVSAPLTRYVVLDKAHFLPLLQSAFQKAGVVFSTTQIPSLTLHIYDKNEIADIIHNIATKNWYVDVGGDGPGRQFSTSTVMDTLYVSPSRGDPSFYDVYTENLTYGNYIYGPKGDIVETQYAPVDYGNDAILTSKDLQISWAPWGHWYLDTIPVVPITSPLVSVHNYWMFTKVHGQIVLAWEKSVYGLDDGTTRTVTRNSANVNMAMLFGSAPHTTTSSTKAKQNPVHAQTATSSATTSTTAAPAPQGFFARIWSWLTSWL